MGGVGRDVKAVDEVGGVGGVGGAVGLEHLFAVPVVGCDEGLSAFLRRASRTRPTQASMVSTALMAAVRTPVWPTISGLAKLRILQILFVKSKKGKLPCSA